MTQPPRCTAVVFDLGGVLTASPFDGFADYEREAGLPVGLIARLNSTDPDANAWARLERRELSPAQFVPAFEAEAAAAGFTVDAGRVLAALAGPVRPAMVRAVTTLRTAGVATALLTNNAEPLDAATEHGALMAGFDAVVQSSVEGARKPEPAIYPLTLQRLGAAVGRDIADDEVAYLDDLGINLKPARARGWHTIKVVDPAAALTELSALTGVDLT